MSISIRSFSMYFMAAFYILAGAYHFINPHFYMAIMPRYLPYHLELVYLSGLFEILFGLMFFSPRTQVLAAWLTIALLIAVCKFFRAVDSFVLAHFIVSDPANIQMAQDFWSQNHPQKYFALGRLPFQFLFIWWAYQYTKPIERRKSHWTENCSAFSFPWFEYNDWIFVLHFQTFPPEFLLLRDIDWLRQFFSSLDQIMVLSFVLLLHLCLLSIAGADDPKRLPTKCEGRNARYTLIKAGLFIFSV